MRVRRLGHSRPATELSFAVFKKPPVEVKKTQFCLVLSEGLCDKEGSDARGDAGEEAIPWIKVKKRKRAGKTHKDVWQELRRIRKLF